MVEGLGAFRNREGDAHGRGRLNVKPLSRHAALAVNLAGSLASFLIETWEHGRAWRSWPPPVEYGAGTIEPQDGRSD